MVQLRRIVLMAALTLGLSASTAWAAAPGAPSGLSAVLGNGSVQLSWNAPTNTGGSAITNYKVYRGTSSGGETLLATVGNVTTYDDTTVTNNTTYYYTVSAVNIDGESGQSSEVSAMPGLPIRPSLPKKVSSAHFVVHYTDAPGAATHITQTQAQNIASLAETAYTTVVTNWSFAAPPSDGTLGGDGKIDIYTTDLSSWNYAFAVNSDGTSCAASTCSIDLDPSIGSTSMNVTAAVFDLVASSIWTFSKRWQVEAAGAWAGMAEAGFPAVDASKVGPWDMSLDCEQLTSPTTNSANCQSDFFTGSGQSRWPFWEFLNERFGSGFLKSVFTNGASSADTNVLDVLTSTIAAKGDTFTNVFNAWATANMDGGYAISSLQTLKPTAAATVQTGTLATLQENQPAGSPIVLTGSIPSTTLTVGHLATKYLALQPGDGSTTGTCFAATLTLSVALPSGAGSAPAFWWSGTAGDGTKQAAQALSVNGTTATISVPWDTCNWGSTYGYLSLPNPSTSDGQSFVVTGTITVDPTTPASPNPPPVEVTLPGLILTAPTTDDTPALDVFGPNVIHLGAGARQLRVVLASTGQGRLQALLGPTLLGTVDIRPGNNDLRFGLSAPVLRTLSARAGGLPLTLTPLSSGGVAGAATVRRVVLG